MQDFLPENHERMTLSLLAMPDLLLSHNKSIVDEIFSLVQLVEDLEAIIVVD